MLVHRLLLHSRWFWHGCPSSLMAVQVQVFAVLSTAAKVPGTQTGYASPAAGPDDTKWHGWPADARPS